MLKPLILVSSAILAVAIAPTLATVGAAPQSGNSASATGQASERGKKLFNQDCAICHGETGDGKTSLAKDMQLKLDDWTDPKFLSGKSDKELFDSIRKGKGDKMPAEDSSRAKDDEIKALVAYIRSFSANAPAATPAAPAPTPAPADAPKPN